MEQSEQIEEPEELVYFPLMQLWHEVWAVSLAMEPGWQGAQIV